MHDILAWLIQLLTVYGYPALFGLLILGIVGLPVPDETLLTFCGYLIYAGHLHPGLTFVVGFLGSVCGISISYWLGLRFGATVLGRFGKYVHLTPARILETERLFVRFGPVLLTIGYFIPGLRHFTAVVAGMSGLPRRRFALFAYFGAALWVGTFLTLGYIFGDQWQRTSDAVHRYVLLATCILAALLAMLWAARFIRKRPMP